MSKNQISRRNFVASMAAVSTAFASRWPLRAVVAGDALDDLKAGWLNPPRSYRPHTRWWWPGSAVTKEGLTWQLEQMRAQGMGGVEVMSAWGWYEKGNIPYLSDQWLEMVRHAVSEAARLDMEVALTFGPGWSFGGFWVPVESRSKVLTTAWKDVAGAGIFEDELPVYQIPPAARQREEPPDWTAPDENKIVAVVAARINGAQLDAASLVDLAAKTEGGRLKWAIPEGRWRLMVFRIKYTAQQNQAQNSPPKNWVVDHLNKIAMESYCEYLGSAFQKGFGEYLGQTVDSFFCDSFEIHPLPNTLLWSTDTLALFKTYKGYDLTPYLPAIWFDIGELTPRIRYDVNEFLHRLGLETAFRTFIDAAARRKVQARIQPHYRFTQELIQGAGMTPRPETEVTTARFEVVTDPRKATAAGAHFYGREIVSAESYTFIHTERYRTSLEDMKRATDAFLRDGVTQFYNHGYVYSPEMQLAPSRDVPWANRISHWNTWWNHYHHLTAYIARSSFLLRQGTFVADVLLYSPQATVWTQKVLFGSERRVMPYGNLGKTLVANGYDFDPVNDDVLQNHARFEKGFARIREQSYRFLILPRILAIPVATLQAIQKFAEAGGIVIAVDALPAASVGLQDYQGNDQQVRRMVTDLFGPDQQGKQLAGGGRTYFIPEYKIEEAAFSPQEQPYKPTPPLTSSQSMLLGSMRRHLSPDVVLEGNRQSDGLTFIHRRIHDLDVYFVTNLQPEPSRLAVSFRIAAKRPERWNPMTGEISPVLHYRVTENGIEIPFDLAPWQSTFIAFRPGGDALHVTRCNLAEVTAVSESSITGIAEANGNVTVELSKGRRIRPGKTAITTIPQPLQISGLWKLSLEGVRFARKEKALSRLTSWTDDDEIRHFSGTGTYELGFELPKEYVRDDLQLLLDLGAVGHVAEVALNERNVGVCWMQPYRLEVTAFAVAGLNRLKVAVTNLLINHVTGLKELPGVPPELIPHYGPTANFYPNGANSFKREANFEPLPASGLMGPVQIIPRQKVTIRW